ncbi:MAG TPA: GIY-YIG nuclease family protein [Patescibacteria group bacterium]|nr:GIY-YIG nuclease family protein [Patescibacteria group bacterium]
MKRAFVYIMASGRNGTLYIGVTADLLYRVHIHKSDVTDGFTKKYGVHDLVYFEEYATLPEAIMRETRMKKWNRAWKITLIEKENPNWRDLYEYLV